MINIQQNRSINRDRNDYLAIKYTLLLGGLKSNELSCYLRNEGKDIVTTNNKSGTYLLPSLKIKILPARNSLLMICKYLDEPRHSMGQVAKCRKKVHVLYQEKKCHISGLEFLYLFPCFFVFISCFSLFNNTLSCQIIYKPKYKDECY